MTALLISLVCLVAVSAAQSTPAPSGTGQEVPLPLSARPKLSMQAALKIADRYITKNHIRISAYWLYEARYTSYGRKDPDKDKEPCWYFWWVSNNRGSNDDEVMVVVFMDGKATFASMFARPH
jgi:hypothetical protein